MEKMLNIVLFGPPGAGKGTQSENLINKYGLVHLSTGDILRTEIARGTALGKKAKEIMDRGELVGDDIVIGMIESKLDENTNAKGFIFDGFPRTSAQAVALDDLLQKKGTGISGMLALEVDDEELTKRLLLRGKDSGRPDDRDETVIRHRIQEYNNKTLPLKNYYHEQGKFHSIEGIGTIDEIFKSLVDRIVFLNAEMDLTSLETDLEHLDLTIQDFEVADDIAPELLLEIDAIKRAEAEEAEEERQETRAKKLDSRIKNQKAKMKSEESINKNQQPRAKNKEIKSSKKLVMAKKINKATPKKTLQKAAPSKKTIKKTVKKLAVKKAVKKAIKKVVKKIAPNNLVKKVVKKTLNTSKKAVKKTLSKKAVKKTVTSNAKKIAPKKATKKTVNKTVAKKSVAKNKKRK